MSIFRICLIGALTSLGACSGVPKKAYVPAPMPVVSAPKPMPAPVSIVPSREPAPVAAVPVDASAAVTSPMPVVAAKPAPAAPLPKAAPVPRTVVVATSRPASAPASRAEAVGPATVSRTTLSGRVSLVGSRGQQVAAGEQADTLVYYVPSKPSGRTRPGQFTVYTHNRDFSPEAIAVPLGSTVTFVNLDDVRHNVFSVTPGASFNLGYQASGEKASHAFGHAGVVLVSCNVHRSMELDMLVVPTPYAAKVAADGSFTLSGLPAGSGKLFFWNPRSQLTSQQLTLPMNDAIRQKLVASKPHMDTQIHTGAGR